MGFPLPTSTGERRISEPSTVLSFPQDPEVDGADTEAERSLDPDSLDGST